MDEFEQIKLSDNLPKIPCVYLLLNNDEVVYVGETVNLRFRMSGHKRRIRDFNEVFDSIMFINIENDKERRELEKKYIEDIDPKLNYNVGPLTAPVPNPWKHVK